MDALQRTAPRARIVIYVREGVTAAQLVQEALSRFNVQLKGPIEVRRPARTVVWLCAVLCSSSCQWVQW